MTEQCNRCQFWKENMVARDPNDENFGFGLCRRAPPLVSEAMVAALMPKLRYGQQEDPDIDIATMTTCSPWPATGSLDWCGSYEPIGGWRRP